MPSRAQLVLPLDIAFEEIPRNRGVDSKVVHLPSSMVASSTPIKGWTIVSTCIATLYRKLVRERDAKYKAWVFLGQDTESRNCNFGAIFLHRFNQHSMSSYWPNLVNCNMTMPMLPIRGYTVRTVDLLGTCLAKAAYLAR